MEACLRGLKSYSWEELKLKLESPKRVSVASALANEASDGRLRRSRAVSGSQQLQPLFASPTGTSSLISVARHEASFE